MYVVPAMSVKTMPASEADAELAAAFIFGGPVLGRPQAAEWGRRRRPEEEDGPAVWLEAIVYLSMLGIYYLSTLSGDDHAAGTGGSAIALLPTCRPIEHGPPVCYDWERPAMMAPPGSGLGYSDWSGDDDGHQKTSIECFYDLVYDATRTCDEWEKPAMVPPGNGSGGDSYWSGNDNDKATMECFYGLVRDAAKICVGWSYDSVHPDDDSYDDPPPT